LLHSLHLHSKADPEEEAKEQIEFRQSKTGDRQIDNLIDRRSSRSKSPHSERRSTEVDHIHEKYPTKRYAP
jgi:hypothetical protein